jgi:hypothetical protein
MEQFITGTVRQVLIAEQSAGSAGREVEITEQSGLAAEGQVSSTK